MLSLWTPMKYASLVAQLRQFNRTCLLCAQSSSRLICQYCEQDIPVYNLGKLDHNLLNDVKVASDIKHVAFHELVALGEYRWPLDMLVTQLKFSKKQINATALATLFCKKALGQMSSAPELIIPVPLHPSRLASRKYNQASLIAKEISRKTGIEIQYDALFRKHKTQAQTELSSFQRAKNTRNAFVLRESISVNHIAIFDDVVTTGATVSEVCETILASYPNMLIDVWTICITPSHQ